jgi:hypothetical protein
VERTDLGFTALTEAWNGAVLASRSGACGSLIVFGGGHNGTTVENDDTRASVKVEC